MDNIKMKSGSADILATGTVIAFSGNPIEIEFGVGDDRLKIIFVFKDEEGKDSKDLRTEGKSLDDSTLQITFFNFSNPLGSGSSKPIDFGALNNRRLYINYRIYELREGDKTLHYTIYLGETIS